MCSVPPPYPHVSKACLFALLGAMLCCPMSVHGTDALVDSAVTALSQLTDPARLALLPDDSAVEAQLGPALGWIHVARRHDVSPESLIARAFQRNGLTGETARTTRESLLRNLARADGWELFNHADSARALAYGRPAPILVGLHSGRLARTVLAVYVEGSFQEAQRPPEGWDFGSLSLRADDEPPPRPIPGRRRNRQKGDRLAQAGTNEIVPKRPANGNQQKVPHVLPPPIIYDDPLPVPDP